MTAAPKPDPKPKRRGGHRDPVGTDLRRRVLQRDGSCVAHRLGFVHVCKDQFGNVHTATDLDRLTLDHVQSGYGRMGLRAPSDEQHLVSLCWFAHLTSGWATANRPRLRLYLEKNA